MPLVQRDEMMSVLPATLPEAALATRLAAVDAAAIIKLGRHFTKVRRLLHSLGLLDGAVYVEHASWPTERVAPLADIDPAGVPYFSTALVRRREPPR
jgi:precorrin-2 C20-methyltransferase/precorrin-3B C17-methyltransferase